MMDQSTGRYRVRLSEEPGDWVWRLEYRDNPRSGESGDYHEMAHGNSVEELEAASTEILRADLRQLRREIAAIKKEN
jgi:hypothetical protein